MAVLQQYCTNNCKLHYSHYQCKHSGQKTQMFSLIETRGMQKCLECKNVVAMAIVLIDLTKSLNLRMAFNLVLAGYIW